MYSACSIHSHILYMYHSVVHVCTMHISYLCHVCLLVSDLMYMFQGTFTCTGVLLCSTRSSLVYVSTMYNSLELLPDKLRALNLANV